MHVTDGTEARVRLAYDEFYRWDNIFEAASAHSSVKHRVKHFCYSAGWKKFERAWDAVIRIRQLSQIRPLLEAVLAPGATSVADLAAEGLPNDASRPQAPQKKEKAQPLGEIGGKSKLRESSHRLTRMTRIRT